MIQPIFKTFLEKLKSEKKNKRFSPSGAYITYSLLSLKGFFFPAKLSVYFPQTKNLACLFATTIFILQFISTIKKEDVCKKTDLSILKIDRVTRVFRNWPISGQFLKISRISANF